MSTDFDCTSRLDYVDVNAARARTEETIHARVLAYYTAATADYRVWSDDFNMHFGFWRGGLNPFDREAMLHEMNVQALRRLGLPTQQARFADLGGGAGATARAAVSANKTLCVDVVTIVPTQVALGKKLNLEAGLGDAITMHCGDYNATGLPEGHYDGVCLIESACHARGASKASVLREAYRLLKPGGRLVIVDGMLRQPLPTGGWLNKLQTNIYQRWCTAWAVPEMARLDLLPDALRHVGFVGTEIEDWSWNVAPSVMHVPVLASHFALKEWVKARGRLPLWRWRHIVASLLTPLLGLRRSVFAYAAVTATKPL